MDDLFAAMVAGRDWDGMERNDEAKALLKASFEERYHATDWGLFQARSNLQRKATSASYAGWITADNDPSGGYQGTSFVWMPAEGGGSVAVLVIGTQGFGADAPLLARPGHRRRLASLARLHGGRLWVKPDLLDRAARVPDEVTRAWPPMKKTLDTYGDVIYAAVVVQDDASREVVGDLVDLFFDEHKVRFKKATQGRWEARKASLTGQLFPSLDEARVEQVLRRRRFVILEGPPGTGKTRMARRIAARIGGDDGVTSIQFHPARTYEDFVVGLAPRPAANGLAFEVRAGDLVRANTAAAAGPHTLVIDEINRADLGKVLGEAIQLFEIGDEAESRTLQLPHELNGTRSLRLSPTLHVLGTRNTADRSIAPIDLAIRRRFAFLPVWPDRQPLTQQADALALQCFDDALHTFAEHADDDGLALVPGHAYFLDPRFSSPEGDGTRAGRAERIAERLRFELLPLLDEYVSARLVGAATSEVAGLADRIRGRLESRSL